MTVFSKRSAAHATSATFRSRSPSPAPATLTWSYTVDGVGNVTAINDGVNPRSYGYEPNLYFLTQGDGPWGTRGWSYDRIGNRMSETRGGVTDTYSYSGGGHNPRLAAIALASGGTSYYTFDAGGNRSRRQPRLGLRPVL